MLNEEILVNSYQKKINHMSKLVDNVGKALKYFPFQYVGEFTFDEEDF